MRRIAFLFFILTSVYAQDYVTYEFSNGRFGDKLISYMHAKWIAYKYDIQLLYKPFKYSDKLKMHELETQYLPFIQNNRRLFNNLQRGIVHNGVIKSDISLHIVPYFPDFSHEDFENSLDADWEDPGFKNELKMSISPTYAFLPPQIPEKHLSIALHVRRGGGADAPMMCLREPLKAPPTSYYIEQLEYLYNKYPDEIFYIYLFTDDPNPQKLADEIEDAFIDFKIHCRTSINRHNLNVLDDFFSMTYFQILIRPESNFSYSAARLADLRLEIAPKEFVIEDGEVSITRVEIREK